MARIVSLLPSATEILFAVGRGEEVVGVSHECDFPPPVRRLPAVTEDLLTPGLPAGTIDAEVARGVADRHTIYGLRRDRLAELAPDLVVTQSLCPVCAVPTSLVEEAVCSLPGRARIVASDPHRLEEVLTSIEEIGAAAGAAEPARSTAAALASRLAEVRLQVRDRSRPRVAVLEWPDPPYAPGHWVPDMVEAAGGHGVIGEAGRPSRRISWEDLLGTDPDVVVLAFCGFDLEESKRRMAEIPPGWRRTLEGRVVVAVDGSAYFSRPGPRLTDGVEMLAWALHGLEHLRPPKGRGARLIDGTWTDLAHLPPPTRAGRPRTG